MSSDQNKLSHIDSDGGVRMVDVGDKIPTARRAVAEGRVRVSSALIEQIEANELVKGLP